MYSNHRLLFLSCSIALFLLACAGSVLEAQTITADPNAQALRVIWQVQGDPIGGNDEVGSDAVGLGDLFDTGRGVWGVHYGELQQWKLFRHDSSEIAADTIPFKTYGEEFSGIWSGEFWGKGKKGVVLYTGSRDTVNGETIYYQELHAFHVEADSISDSIATMMNTRTMTPLTRVSISSDALLAADLDRDGADELIAAFPGVITDTGIRYNTEIWIFKGGPDFQLESPTLVVQDTRPADALWLKLATGDFDGDGHTDIFIGGTQAGEAARIPRLMFYWGNGTLDGFLDPNNRRTVDLKGEGVNPLWCSVLDCDGDGLKDIVLDDIYNPAKGIYLYRSGSGRNARSRSYIKDDADIVFPNESAHRNAGHLNDEMQRYEMLFMGGSPRKFFSGGDAGPDLAYDAFSYGTTFSEVVPVLDVDGDGWDDLLTGTTQVNIRAGIAVIYAGGPYIPSPKVSGVEAIAGEGHQQAITVWPNPLRDDLHIAWRGDLRRTPRSFRVHDLLGRDVAHGNVPAGSKAALWRSGDLPNGIYLLSVHAHDGTIITTTRIIKQ